MADPYAEMDLFWDKPFQVVPDDEPRQLRELVRYATLAPNAHNVQPWQFGLGERTISIFPDHDRALPMSDPGDREMFISLGCAVENMVLAARRVGWEPTVEYFPDDVDEDCIRVTFTEGEPETEDPLFQAIPRRQSNRRSYDGKPIPRSDLEAIESSIATPGIWTRIYTEEPDLERVVDVTDKGFAWQRSSKEFRDELIGCIRFSKDEIVRHRDGLSSRATGRPTIPEWFGRAFFQFLSLSGLEAREIAGKVRGSSAALVLVSDDNDRVTWVKAGRGLERIKLTATARGVVCAHLNNNWQWKATKGPAQEAFELGDAHPHVTIRLGYAPRLPYSGRRPVEEVIRPTD